MRVWHPVPNRENAALASGGLLAGSSVPDDLLYTTDHPCGDSRALPGPAMGILVRTLRGDRNTEGKAPSAGLQGALRPGGTPAL